MSTDKQHKSLPRITLRHIFAQVLESFNFERGLPYTLKALLVQPDIAIRTYLFTDRSRLVKPFSFLLLTTAIFVFITFQFFEQQTQDSISLPFEHPFFRKIEQTLQFLSDKIIEYVNTIFILSIPITSLTSYWVFSKSKLNYAEHLVINAYIYGYAGLLMLFAVPIISTNENLGFLGFLTNVYTIYVYIKVFDEKVIKGIIKALVAVTISQIITLLLFALIVILITFF